MSVVDVSVLIILMMVVGFVGLMKQKNVSKDAFNKTFSSYIDVFLDLGTELYEEYKNRGKDPFGWDTVVSKEFERELGEKIKEFMIKTIGLNKKLVDSIPPDILLDCCKHIITLIKREATKIEKLNIPKENLKININANKTDITSAIAKASRED